MQAIREYKNSETYQRAATAQSYYTTDNEAIGARLGYLERQMRSKVNVKFHRLRNAFFPKAVKRLVLYLMGNGATLDDTIKAKIDRKFDNTMILGAINACVDGVLWGFPDLDKLTFFRATEFVPLFDERTGYLKAGIRFWQLEENKPMYIELYEDDGITEFEAGNKGTSITETTPKRSYQQTIRRDAFSETAINGENYGILPIFPLYANELGTSELTTGLQALIDAYDFVSSDWVDFATLVDNLYGLFKNYGGDDPARAWAEIISLKSLLADGNDANSDLRAVEMPFASKQALLDFLERRMYDDFLLPDARNDGRAVTATEIKAAREDMDIKADLLEWQVAEFVEQVLLLKGFDMLLPNYARRTTTNDGETVNNIATQLSGGWITKRMAITLDPTIPQEEKEQLIFDVELEDTGIPPDDTEVDGESVSGEEAEAQAEQVAGKTLTGIQTTSLIGVIEKYAAGALTLQQAINIVSVSIGVTQEEARRIIEGLQ